MDKQILAQNLDLLVGQDQTKQLVTSCLMADSCSAYLLVGPPHIGKGFLARLMTASLHNETNINKVHPDTVIFDDILLKNTNDDNEREWKQSVDDFIHLIYLSPILSSKKIGIVENIDRFSPQALNALLKTLEEPPARAIIILTAQDASTVLPTILSRVQTIRLRYLSDAEIENYVRSKQTDHVAEITLLANGAVGIANNLIRDSKLLDKALVGVENFSTWLNKDIFKILQMANIKDRDEGIKFIELWLNLTRRVWLSKAGLQSALTPNLTVSYSSDELIKLMDRLQLALHALRANTNVRITLEATLLEVL